MITQDLPNSELSPKNLLKSSHWGILNSTCLQSITSVMLVMPQILLDVIYSRYDSCVPNYTCTSVVITYI